MARQTRRHCCWPRSWPRPSSRARRTPTQQSTGQAIDDGVVTAKVKAKLIEDPMTKAHQINVETFKGTVQLSGFVESNEARSRALQLARDTDGVKGVKDALEVRKGEG